MSQLRYNIGQKVLVLFYVLNGRVGFVNPLYMPWQDKLDELMVKVLTITEHHKVAWDQDPNSEAKYDGFLAVDEDGQPWGNQYPKASYGQLSDQANWYFERVWPTGTDFTGLPDKELVPFEDVCMVMNRVHRGIKHFGVEGSANYDQAKTAALSAHLEALKAIVGERLNAAVEFEAPFPSVPEITHAVIKPL